MSIVSVHTPNMVTSGAGGAGTGQIIYDASNMSKATASMTNGLVFTLEPVDTTRAAADYDWTLTGGTPSSQADTKTPFTVTYATAGNKTATLVIPNAVSNISNKAL